MSKKIKGLIRGFCSTLIRGRKKRLEKTSYVTKGKREWSMNTSQREIFDLHRDDPFVVATCPPGSGKSKALKFVGAHVLSKDPPLRQIVVIPQLIIEKTFKEDTLIYPDNKKLCWKYESGNNVCGETTEAKIKRVIKFIERDKFLKGGIQSRILMCTHVTLAKAFERLEKKYRNNKPKLKKLFSNIMFCIDEAHHILSSINGGTEIANKIGRFVSFILSERPSNTRLWLTTATMFRGDKNSVLKDEDYEKFKTYFLPFDLHWQNNMQYIKTFAYDFISYRKNDPFQQIRSILSIKENRRKTIIFCPSKAQRLANGCKYSFVKKLNKIVEEAWPGVRTLDLVTEGNLVNQGNIKWCIDSSGRKKVFKNRDERKKYIFDEKKSKDVDVVFAIDLFNEGTDWEYASQAIDLVPNDSLRLVVQKFGRLLRDVPGKSHVHYFLFLPEAAHGRDKEEERMALTSNFAAFTASLLLEDYIKPITTKRKKRKTADVNGRRFNVFEEEVPDPRDRLRIALKVESRLFDIGAGNGNISTQKVFKIICQELKIQKVKNNIEEIATHIAAMLRRRLPNFNVDVSALVDGGFDKVWHNDIFPFVKGFGSGVSDCNTMSEFRDVFDNTKMIAPYEMACEFVQQFRLRSSREYVDFAKYWNRTGKVLKKYEKRLLAKKK